MPTGPVQGPQANLGKKFDELCRGTNALDLQTLYDETFESNDNDDDEDDDDLILPTMIDAC